MYGLSFQHELLLQLCYYTLCFFIVAQVFDELEFGPGVGPIWFDELQCSGLESQLLDCATMVTGESDCTHSEDAGVRCRGS